jgi:hypothetical protein
MRSVKKMDKAPVDTVTITKPTSRAKARIALAYTRKDGYSASMKTSAAHEPTENMIEMASQLAEYLTTGKRPKGWIG